MLNTISVPIQTSPPQNLTFSYYTKSDTTKFVCYQTDFTWLGTDVFKNLTTIFLAKDLGLRNLVIDPSTPFYLGRARIIDNAETAIYEFDLYQTAGIIFMDNLVNNGEYIPSQGSITLQSNNSYDFKINIEF